MSTRHGSAYLVAAALLVVGCTAGDDGSEEGGDGTTTDSIEAAAPSATGPSPGVTDDAVEIGVVYVDTEALTSVGLNYDLGDYEAVYQALFDDLNADGGVNGRQVEPVFAPVDPTTVQPAEEACVQLTEDADVFMVVGFFLTDAVICSVATHETAVIGGEMTPERLEQAAAPWLSWLPDTDQPENVIRTLAAQGELDGRVAVYANARDEEQVDEHVLPVLEELGIEPVAVGLEEGDDVPSLQASTATISEAFQAADADTIILAGASAQDWPSARDEDTSYRPKLLFLDSLGLSAFATNDSTTDTSILDGALAGGGYGPNQARFEEPEMQACIQTLADAGVEVPAPDDVGDDPSDQPFQAAFQACPDIAVLRAWLGAAGEDLNYGTLDATIDGLEISIPGDPEPRTYGPPPDADGNPTAYLFAWDDSTETLVPVEG